MAKYTIVTEQAIDERDDVPATVDMWYDRGERAWIIQLKDHRGYQVGAAEYVYSGKADAVIVRNQMREAL